MDATQRLLKRNSLYMWDSIKKNNAAKIDEIFTSGFPVDSPITDTGLTALAFASSWSNDENIFQTILKFSPNVNAQNCQRKTPLHQAALAGNIVALQILLKQPNI